MDVNLFEAEIPQVQTQTQFLKIADPQTARRVRVFVPGEQAQMIYENLKIRELPLAELSGYTERMAKSGEGINCMQQLHEGQIIYSCYLYIDLSVGSIDKPDPTSL